MLLQQDPSIRAFKDKPVDSNLIKSLSSNLPDRQVEEFAALEDLCFKWSKHDRFS